jgi:hypothetical protein
MRTILSLLVSLSFAAAACSSGPNGGPASVGTLPDGGSDMPPSASTAPGDTTEPGGPVFLSFGLSAGSIDENGTFTVSAVLSDPDGTSDLAGGSLVDVASGRVLGAFGTGAQKGGYQVQVTWGALNEAFPIDFAKGASPARAVTARFFDQKGHVAEKSETIKLRCSKAELGACGGKCLDVSADDDNCSACGKKCDEYLTCSAGACHGSQTTCTACLGNAKSTTCKAEIDACLGSQACIDLDDCVQGCSSVMCKNTCQTTHAAGAAQYNAAISCRTAACGSACTF